MLLTPEQLEKKHIFIDNYVNAKNAADGSTMDANANVTLKNIATLESELMKDYFIQVNRAQVSKKIKQLYGEALSEVCLSAHPLYLPELNTCIVQQGLLDIHKTASSLQI